MSEQWRTVIAERPRLQWGELGPERVIFHLPLGPDVNDAWFQPIKCGGGISLHGGREKVPRSMVCPDCLAGREAG